MAERRPARRARLDTPLEARSAIPRPHYDPEAFGRVSERIARFLGTARFLVYLTLFVIVWLLWNTLAPESLQFDPKRLNYTLLTLLLSLQASYAAPLILLAQNRQADRDRVSQEEDRAQNARLQADVEYLSREVASLRSAVGEVATRDFLRDQLRELTDELAARSGDGPDYDPEARGRRADRERKAERKKRRELRTEEQAVPGGLGEPFVGDDDSG
ncbi:MAG: rane protein [Frankiales bacterium]|nr:rane protein [Frankiales bacterium]